MIRAEASNHAATPESGAARSSLTAAVMPRPAIKTRLLILGTGCLAKDLCASLIEKPASRYEVVGFLDSTAARIGERLVNPAIIGTMDRLFEAVERHRVQAIAVCLEDRRAVLPVQALLDVKALGLQVMDGHRLYEKELGRLPIDAMKPSNLIFSSGFQCRTLVKAMKRTIDVVASVVGLVMLLPVFVAVAMAIKRESPGPVLYCQTRVGLRGAPYIIWKLRSMHRDAETEGPCWASENDPRVFRVGRWIRKWRIDELPQLINVLKGEMSLIGPRPERPLFVKTLRENIPYYDMRHMVKPGITGWAQIRYRYAASAEETHEKLQYDLYYVKNLSLGLDLRILLETVRVVLQGEGAR